MRNLQNRIEEMKNLVNNYGYADAVAEFKNICYEYEVCLDTANCYLDNEDIDTIVKSKDSWTSIAIFLSNVQGLNGDFYHLDGYENLEEITKETLLNDISELEDTLIEEGHLNNLEVLLDSLTANTELEEKMLDIFKSNALDYNDSASVLEGISNGEFCPTNGSIPELIYYAQTKDIFKEHFNEILEIYSEFVEDCGDTSVVQELNANSLVWLTFELLVTRWFNELEEACF